MILKKEPSKPIRMIHSSSHSLPDSFSLKQLAEIINNLKKQRPDVIEETCIVQFTDNGPDCSGDIFLHFDFLEHERDFQIRVEDYKKQKEKYDKWFKTNKEEIEIQKKQLKEKRKALIEKRKQKQLKDLEQKRNILLKELQKIDDL